jgi:hypothetical protein
VEPGRMLGEIKKEHRDARKHNFLVPYQQVEFYKQTRGSVEVLCPLSRVVAGRRLDVAEYVCPHSSVRDLPGVPVVVRRRR